MKFIIIFIVVAMVLIEVQGKNLSAGRQILNNSLHLPQPAPQRYATKEIILYLTPSQIRALQQGQGLINLPPVRHADKYKDGQEQIHPQALAHEQNGQPNPQLEHQQSFKPPTRQELQSDSFVPISPSLDYRKPDPSLYNTFQLQPQNQKRFLKPIQFFPDSDKISPDNERKTVPTFTPQEFLQENDHDTEITRQKLKEQWLNLLNQNIAHFKALEALTQNQRASSENKTNFHYLSQNEHTYNNQRYASDVYNLVRSNNEHQLAKQQTLLNIKHIPHLIAHVPVPVPTPVFIPISDSFKDNGPRTYDVPLELLGTVSIPIVKTQTNDVIRPVPTSIKQHATIPTTKNADIDRPFFTDHSVPVENQGSWPVHRHEWHH